jgi:DNA-binding NtrC family response regulator
MAPCVYLFEDDDSLRELLVEVLRDDLGAEVGVCGSIDAVRDLCAVRRPDLIVADFWGSSHLRLADAERSEINALAALAPTVLVSARNWLLSADSEELGVAGLVTKPLDINRLINLLRETLGSVQVAAEQATELPPRESMSVFILNWP